MSVVEDSLLFDRIIPLLLVSNRISVRLEVYGTTGILTLFQNVYDGALVPEIRILWHGPVDRQPGFLSIGDDRQNLFFPKLLCDLHRSTAFHAEIEDVPDDLGSLFINDPLFRILWIFDIPEGRMVRQMFAPFTLGLVDRADLSTGVPGIELIEPHPDPGEVIVHTVLIGRIEIVIDGNIADIMFCKSDVDEHPRHRGIASKTRKVFCQKYRHMVRLDFFQHGLKAGTVEVGSAVSVIDKENRICEMVFLTVGL